VRAINVDFEWVPLEAEVGKPYRYPFAATKHMKESYSQPGVYRWAVFAKETEPWAVYIGEAEDLVRRLAGYLKPGNKQQTNLRIKQYLDERLTSGSRIEFHKLDFSPFKVNGVELSIDTCHKSPVRKILENLAILQHEKKLCTVMNRTADVREKKRVKAASHLGLSRDKLATILKAIEEG